MVWEQNSRIIVMLTKLQENGKEKCAQYWTAFGSKQNIFVTNEFSIKTLKETKNNSGYTRSLFEVFNSTTEESRLILHYQYVDWPEYGAPTNTKSFTNLIWDVNDQYRSTLINEVNRLTPGPIIVHCSAGVGRTGTFCAIDSCIYQLAKTKEVSVPKIVMQIREQRCLSVIAVEQYVFIYTVLHEFLQLFDTSAEMRQFFCEP
ncbi:tyrosine-protein phosphatase non-receptor type 1-like [Cydia pomonella]|uniref:tyrosine-protein phosphatase non-receptor type 1-like n=1 Tax=Cydia pomonella TaxID=82600 RepID=UPI002ADDF8D4|nr:tyrosine-protein phosphatase non-receptor type 1-like [Cydia pomonella]